MERSEYLAILQSISGAALVLGAALLISTLDPHARLSPPSLAGVASPDVSGNDDHALLKNQAARPVSMAIDERSHASFSVALELMPDPDMPLSMAAAQLPWSALERYRFYCSDSRRFYPDTTECRNDWQVALTDYQ